MVNRNEIRIISGQWRSRKVSFPDGLHLRPTPDRVRETLFNWLRDDVVGANCLDLFAGSGVLGLEALSRGARHATFVDNNKAAIQSIEANAEKFESLNLDTFCTDAIGWLEGQPSLTFDVVFLDPPYDKPLIEPALNHLIEKKLLNDNALIYVEAGQALDTLHLPAGLRWSKQEKASQVYYGLLRYIPTAEAEI